ncbi:hypothetical protein AB5I41_19430 [Sphingomonas sp. MMS24-JH45]
MFHDRRLSAAARAESRPASAVGHGVGIAGLAGLIGWIALARHYGMDGPDAALVGVLACGLPMVLWSLVVDRVHRRASTGLDWDAGTGLAREPGHQPRQARRPVGDLGAIGLCYATFRFYWDGPYTFSMAMLAAAAPLLFVASIPYVLWIDRYLVEPKDGAWALGAWLIGARHARPRGGGGACAQLGGERGLPRLHDRDRAGRVRGFRAGGSVGCAEGSGEPVQLAHHLHVRGRRRLRLCRLSADDVPCRRAYPQRQSLRGGVDRGADPPSALHHDG